MNLSTLVCPFSFANIDKNASRIGAGLISIALGAFALTGSIGFLALVVLEFVVRVFAADTKPPIGYVAAAISQALNLPKKPVNRGPKMFAWRVGFLFAVTALALFFVNPGASLAVAFLLLGFTLLEAVFNFCVGCIVYTYINLPLVTAFKRA
jgi:Domain of unknown function (DUF4395)